jgi:hypothetical protein
MTEIRLDAEADYEAMCALLGPLDYRAFLEGYTAYERWKQWRVPVVQPEMVALAIAS